MKNTLVIHPKDETTVMLKYVYANHPEWTVCEDNGISRNELMELISKHDRIIMLGHGTPYGLINSKRTGFLIDDSYAELLRNKETVSIWCYSHEYFLRNKLPGFHTGMIISEVGEEHMVLGEAPLDERQIYINMINFSKVISECIEMPPREMRKYVLEHYTGQDAVTCFNRNNIYVV